MEILGIGPAELVLILLVAFVVLGPERLPAVARTLGRWLRYLRGLSGEFTSQLQSELGDTAQELRTAQQELHDLPQHLYSELQTPLSSISQELRQSTKGLSDNAIENLGSNHGQAETSPPPDV